MGKAQNSKAELVVRGEGCKAIFQPRPTPGLKERIIFDCTGFLIDGTIISACTVPDLRVQLQVGQHKQRIDKTADLQACQLKVSGSNKANVCRIPQ